MNVVYHSNYENRIKLIALFLYVDVQLDVLMCCNKIKSNGKRISL